jgi:hypothetical protein
MYSIALALSMLALEEASAAARDTLIADPEPAPLDAAGRVAHAAAWRRWAAEGRNGIEATLTPDDGATARQPLPTGATG